MKKIYTLLATLVAVFVMSASAVAQDTDPQAAKDVTVLWNTVSTEPDSITVTAQLEVTAGKTFSATVYAAFFSWNNGIDFGHSVSQQVTLPRTVSSDKEDANKTDLMTWKIAKSADYTSYVSGSSDEAKTMRCVLYYQTAGSTVPMPLARVDVLSSGTTGVDDIAAEDSSVKEVYSLGGVRVASGDDVDMQSLAPGMYIVRQGSKYTKVLR